MLRGRRVCARTRLPTDVDTKIVWTDFWTVVSDVWFVVQPDYNINRTVCQPFARDAMYVQKRDSRPYSKDGINPYSARNRITAGCVLSPASTETGPAGCY